MKQFTSVFSIVISLLGFSVALLGQGKNGNDVSIEIDGEELMIDEAMDLYKVPGVSIVVIKGFEIHDRIALGYADEYEDREVNYETQFCVGGMTQLVTAAMTLHLCSFDRLDLDYEVNELLKSWELQYGKYEKSRSITVRRLLNHTAGFTQYFKPNGYYQDELVPSITQILDGLGNMKEVKIRTEPGTFPNHSFESYVLLQQVLEDFTGHKFEELAEDLVFEPLDMKNSSFEQFPTATAREMRATGYDSKGEEIKGKWKVYPELGTAGLWCSAEDYAKVLIDLAKTNNGQSGKLINQQMCREMQKPVKDEWAMGFNNPSKSPYTFVGGGADGFFTRMNMNFEAGCGLVMLTNSHINWRFLTEIQDDLARHYGLEGYFNE